MNSKFKGSLILGIGVLIFLWWQAQQPLWNPHLQVDVWVSWERINYYFSHGKSFLGMRGNEILPTTLLYLFVPTWLVPVGFSSYANYLPATLLVNFMVLLISWYYALDKKIILLSLLFFGPILLFRFDGLVLLMMILAFLNFKNEKYALSGFLLGIAVGMKVFPIIFLPYLGLILVQKRKFKSILRLLIGMGEALLVPLIIYAWMGGSWEQVKIALAFHSQKLISIESVVGSLITGWSLLMNGVPPTLLPGNGIWSVAGPAILFNKLWIVPLGIMYWGIWRKRELYRHFEWSVPLTLMLVFLVFSKNLNPQYLWWYMAMLPFVMNSWVELGISYMIGLLNQLVYPIFYTILIDNFYQTNQDYWIYFLLLLRNIGVITLMILYTNKLFGSKRK